MWEVASNKNVARFGPKSIADPERRVIGLEVLGGRELSQCVTRAPKGLGRLLRSELAAVPHDIRLGASSGGERRHTIDGGTANR